MNRCRCTKYIITCPHSLQSAPSSSFQPLSLMANSGPDLPPGACRWTHNSGSCSEPTASHRPPPITPLSQPHVSSLDGFNSWIPLQTPSFPPMPGVQNYCLGTLLWSSNSLSMRSWDPHFPISSYNYISSNTHQQPLYRYS